MRASRGVRTWVRRNLKTILVLVLVVVVASGGYVGWVAIRRAQPTCKPSGWVT